MWLGAAKLRRADPDPRRRMGSPRAGLVSVTASACWRLPAGHTHDTAGVRFDQLLAHPQVLFILAVLPPAANIVICETHYRRR